MEFRICPIIRRFAHLSARKCPCRSHAEAISMLPGVRHPPHASKTSRRMPHDHGAWDSDDRRFAGLTIATCTKYCTLTGRCCHPGAAAKQTAEDDRIHIAEPVAVPRVFCPGLTLATVSMRGGGERVSATDRDPDVRRCHLRPPMTSSLALRSSAKTLAPPVCRRSVFLPSQFVFRFRVSLVSTVFLSASRWRAREGHFAQG